MNERTNKRTNKRKIKKANLNEEEYKFKRKKIKKQRMKGIERKKMYQDKKSGCLRVKKRKKIEKELGVMK